jgi:Glycosyl transferases group 1
MLPGASPLQSASKPYGSREWSVFVAATWNGVPKPLWESLEESPAKNLLVGIVERLLADREASLLDAFNDTADKLKLGARLGVDPAFDDQMIPFLRDPLTYFRHLDRINIIRSLADSGLPLTICGPGWQDFLGERSNVTYLDHRVDFKDLPALYGNSKVVINLNAGNGACERAMQAAMAGAAVVSDYSESLAHLFQGLDGRMFFDRAKMGDVAEVAGRLIESDEGETMAERCHAQVLETGLWRHRAAQMVEFLTAA